MDYKLEYITKLFQKTSKKAIEHYCLTRLWHKLDNDKVKIVTQQYVRRISEKYALTDFFIPQFKIHIEVNEPAHYDSNERINEDQKRKEEIEKSSGHQLIFIDCREDLSQIHNQIDNIVKTINGLIFQQKENGKFEPWQPENERNPDYWKSKGVINVFDDISFNKIEDICKLFDLDPQKIKRGFLRYGGYPDKIKKVYSLWWPSEGKRQGWQNFLSEDEKEIVETHVDQKKKAEHYQLHLKSNEIRIVFFHHKDFLGLKGYKFKGIFMYDSKKSNPSRGTVWKQIGTQFKLPTIEKK